MPKSVRLVSLVFLFLAAAIYAQQPAGERWWPSEWGPDDQRGAANRWTPEKVLEAKSLIETGQIYQLGRAV